MVNLRNVQQKKKKKGEKRNTNTKRVAVAYALLNSDRESCYWTRKIIMVFLLERYPFHKSFLEIGSPFICVQETNLCSPKFFIYLS